MNFEILLSQRIPIQAFLALSTLSTFLNFLGVVISQSAITVVRATNPLGLYWYLFILQLSLVLLIFYSLQKDALFANKSAIIAFSVIFLGTFPKSLDDSIVAAQITSGSFASGAGLIAAGIIMFVIPLFAFVGYLSMDKLEIPRFEMKKAPQTTSDLSVVNLEQATIPMPNAPVIPHMSPENQSKTQSDNSVQKTTAVALYAYEANPSDPNEVSFPKGQVMEVLDNKGKWWQVTFSHPDGSTVKGIAPSNYLQLQ